MKISFVELQNFRKLKAARIDFDEETTLFVGANNSGKTSAMQALRYFLISPGKLSLRDITLTNWPKIDAIGRAWENREEPSEKLEALLPALDLWLDVALSEIHHVVHILPTIEWQGGLIGVRLQYEPKSLERLRDEYFRERQAQTTVVRAGDQNGTQMRIWPSSLTDFLEKRLSKHLELKAYALDPDLCVSPSDGVAAPQALREGAAPLDKAPFKSLIRIDEIAAQRDFSDAGEHAVSLDGQGDGVTRKYKRRLSDQLRSYYDRHLDPLKTPTEADYEALNAIQKAEKNFDQRLKDGFSVALAELQDLGYPGVNNPRLKISTQLRATDGLNHNSAVQYEVADPTGDGANALHLPEDYAGLGYQNLISMVFMLMSYRDDWMRVGKAAQATTDEAPDSIPLLHLVLVEEPEAHLHAQVQQVFIKKAYALLRQHQDLGDQPRYGTQLVVSTHSSHVAHEADFSSLRYFRRRQALSLTDTPTTTVANLSHIFGDGDETTRFVKRYLKATHCDLFFADGVIIVEGQAERILIPHFIRHHFPDLSRQCLTLLELGGSHAHRFKSLIDCLGITLLIITDLDAVQQQDGKGQWKAAKPVKGSGQKSANEILKQWHPAIEILDQLIALKPEDHGTDNGGNYDLYVAYQKPVMHSGSGGEKQEVIPRTFEDALIVANTDVLEAISGSAASEKIKRIVGRNLSGEELTDELFQLLKSAEKAAFALDCLMLEDPQSLVPPEYIAEGLSWLQRTLDEKNSEARQLTEQPS